MGDKFFSLFLMLFGGLICDLRNGCFVGEFALIGVVDVCFCLNYNIESLLIPNPLLSWWLVTFGRVCFF